MASDITDEQIEEWRLRLTNDLVRSPLCDLAQDVYDALVSTRAALVRMEDDEWRAANALAAAEQKAEADAVVWRDVFDQEHNARVSADRRADTWEDRAGVAVAELIDLRERADKSGPLQLIEARRYAAWFAAKAEWLEQVLVDTIDGTTAQGWELVAAEARIAAVRELHVSQRRWYHQPDECKACLEDYPCATIAALDGPTGREHGNA